MTPEAALARQIACYRQMSREQRVLTALRLHAMACDMSRLGIRRQHPEADETMIDELLRRRLALARGL
jgi:hypothetical protein